MAVTAQSQFEPLVERAWSPAGGLMFKASLTRVTRIAILGSLSLPEVVQGEVLFLTGHK